jgi:hypothetical protein
VHLLLLCQNPTLTPLRAISPLAVKQLIVILLSNTACNTASTLSN